VTTLRSTKAATRLILSGFRDRGWRDPGDTALQIAEGLLVDSPDGSAIRYEPKFDRSFLDLNNITAAEATAQVRETLKGIKVKAEEAQPQRLKILFFAANPFDQTQLRLDEEIREVQQRIRATDHRDVIDLVPRLAVRTGDLMDAINQERPQIIHFSGHGSIAEQLVFQDDRGRTTVASKEAIAAMLETVSDEVRLVLFNNCFSQAHAVEAVRHIEAAIGMNTTIGDDAARLFAASFYASLGYGRSVQRAFDQARAELMLASIPEEQTPQLLTHAGIKASEMHLVEKPPSVRRDA